MILSFKKQFIPYIKNKTKIHTIIEDESNRWAVGKVIHFWAGNPRNISQKPYQFGIGEVTKILNIKIIPKTSTIILENEETLTPAAVLQLAIRDGFDTEYDFFNFFKTEFIGKLIYFNFNDLKESGE